jgi:signal recognition particle subunit SRP19
LATTEPALPALDRKTSSIGKQGKKQGCSNNNSHFHLLRRDRVTIFTGLKDYDHVILWLDYFNKNLKRRQGRKVNRDQAVFDPTVQDLTEAAKAAGFEFSQEEVNDNARFPRRSFAKSGYVMVAKKETVKKSQMINTVAEKMLQKKSRQKSGGIGKK